MHATRRQPAVRHALAPPDSHLAIMVQFGMCRTASGWDPWIPRDFQRHLWGRCQTEFASRQKSTRRNISSSTTQVNVNFIYPTEGASLQSERHYRIRLHDGFSSYSSV
jgi:hypothetical protein